MSISLARRLLGATAAIAMTLTSAQLVPSLAYAQTAPAAAPNGTAKPNILVIFGDDIGQTNISAYSNGLLGYKTPNIDSIAKAGMMFTDYYAENSCTAGGGEKTAPQRLNPQAVFDARKEIGAVTVSDPVENYIVALVFATRYPDRYDKDLAKLLQVGVSPRGVIGLDKVSRSYAWLKGRTYVTPDDVMAIVHDVFRHRLILSYEAHASNTSADEVIDRIVQLVAVS